MSDNTNEIGRKIKKYRKIKNISQEILADTAGIHVSMIKKYECGFRNPKPDQLLKIANALGISINALYSHDINTVSDVITMLIQLDEQTALKISGDKDDSGNYKPSSISLSFDDDKINESISKYLAYKDRINSINKLQMSHINENNVEKNISEPDISLDTLITSDAIIKRPSSN